ATTSRPPPHAGVARALWHSLGLAHHASVGRLRAGTRLQRVDGVGAAERGLRVEARVRGRPEERRDVPFRRHSVPVRPLWLLRLNRTARALPGEAQLCHVELSVPARGYRPRSGNDRRSAGVYTLEVMNTMFRNNIKTVVLLTVIG